MTLQQFMNEAISPWMREDGPDSDIVLSSRIRLARNFADYSYPILANQKDLQSISKFIQDEYEQKSFQDYQNFEFIPLSELKPVEKRVLVEKHLISPHLVEHGDFAATLISRNEQVSVMINEEDHIRAQLYFPGFQLKEALEKAFEFDDWLEEKIDYVSCLTRSSAASAVAASKSVSS